MGADVPFDPGVGVFAGVAEAEAVGLTADEGVDLLNTGCNK
jgi:hypothetical protein